MASYEAFTIARKALTRRMVIETGEKPRKGKFQAILWGVVNRVYTLPWQHLPLCMVNTSFLR